MIFAFQFQITIGDTWVASQKKEDTMGWLFKSTRGELGLTKRGLSTDSIVHPFRIEDQVALKHSEASMAGMLRSVKDHTLYPQDVKHTLTHATQDLWSIGIMPKVSKLHCATYFLFFLAFLGTEASSPGSVFRVLLFGAGFGFGVALATTGMLVLQSENKQSKSYKDVCCDTSIQSVTMFSKGAISFLTLN